MKTYKTPESNPVLNRTSNGIEDICFTDEDKANCLNDYFISVSTIDDANSTLPPFERKIVSSLDTIHIERSDNGDIIACLDINKAVGPDLISHRVLKHIHLSISKPLFKLFNKSLSAGIFPSKWKSTCVMSLYKKGDKHCPVNYRSVSLLSCLGKLMERCVYTHSYNYLISNKLIYETQTEFLARHLIRQFFS